MDKTARCCKTLQKAARGGPQRLPQGSIYWPSCKRQSRCGDLSNGAPILRADGLATQGSINTGGKRMGACDTLQQRVKGQLVHCDT